MPAAWEHPVVDVSGPCGMCFGSGRVVDLGLRGIGDEATYVAEAPCPACARKKSA